MLVWSGLKMVFPVSCTTSYLPLAIPPVAFPCSFVTTTFVVEAMAAANAQLRWKRMENHQVCVLPLSLGGAWVQSCSMRGGPRGPILSLLMPRGLMSKHYSETLVPELRLDSRISLANRCSVCSLNVMSWVP